MAGDGPPTESIFDDGYYRVESIEGRAYHIARTDRQFVSIGEVHDCHRGLVKFLQSLAQEGPLDVILDLRAAKLRSDAAFEIAMERYRHQFMTSFRRVAAVLSTAVGRLQLQRQLRDEDVEHSVFADAEPARAWLLNQQALGSDGTPG